MLAENADEPYGEEIAKTIVKLRKKGTVIRTTTQLREAVAAALSFLPDNGEKRELTKKTCQRVFQALRIDINNEFEVLETFLSKLPQTLSEGGRVAILTFHSGEDRLVKKPFRSITDSIFLRRFPGRWCALRQTNAGQTAGRAPQSCAGR